MDCCKPEKTGYRSAHACLGCCKPEKTGYRSAHACLDCCKPEKTGYRSELGGWGCCKPGKTGYRSAHACLGRCKPEKSGYRSELGSWGCCKPEKPGYRSVTTRLRSFARLLTQKNRPAKGTDWRSVLPPSFRERRDRMSLRSWHFSAPPNGAHTLNGGGRPRLWPNGLRRGFSGRIFRRARTSACSEAPTLWGSSGTGNVFPSLNFI
ncbi:hypothetical protein J2Z45_002765 [Cohnella lubricantis]|nr:hypothetical protein [Cohnella lubricantis]